MPHGHFNHILDVAQQILAHYGYVGVFALIFAENFGLPLPGETIFIAAILLAAKGEMRIVPVVLCAWLGAVLGGVVGFAIGRFFGNRVLEKYGRYVGINPERLHKVDRFFARYGLTVVLLGRFFEVVRQIYAILAGCMAVSWRRFLIYNVGGATLWVGFWTVLMLWFGRHMRQLWDLFKAHETYVFLTVALIAALSALFLHLRRRDALNAFRSTASGPGDAPPP